MEFRRVLLRPRGFMKSWSELCGVVSCRIINCEFELSICEHAIDELQWCLAVLLKEFFVRLRRYTRRVHSSFSRAAQQELGRATVRGRVCRLVEISVADVSLKK